MGENPALGTPIQWRKANLKLEIRGLASPEMVNSGFFVLKRDAIEFEPVIDQFVAELAGDLGLQFLDLLGGELDHLAVAQIDQVVMVAVAHLLVARAALAKIMPLD